MSEKAVVVVFQNQRFNLCFHRLHELILHISSHLAVYTCTDADFGCVSFGCCCAKGVRTSLLRYSSR